MTRLRAWFLLPTWLLLVSTIAIPLGIIVYYSLLTRGAYGGAGQPLTLESYTRLFDPLYAAIFLRSFLFALVATVLCLILGFPLALFIARSAAWRNLYLALVILPFWTSFLIRLYAWIFLLRDSGLINTLLLSLGWLRQPLPLLYNNGAVLLGLVYSFLPFAVLPMYASLERMDKNLLEAAADLGARPLTVLMRVMVPMAVPGIWAAGLLVFIPCLGTYLVSDLLGGSKTVLVGNLVQNQFTAARDWPFGSAISLVLMLAAVLLILMLRGKSNTENVELL